MSAEDKIKLLEEKMKLYERMQVCVDNSSINIPLPKPVYLSEGNVSENFLNFKRAWENYVIASGLEKKPEREKIAVMLTALGEEIFNRYPNFTISDDEKNKSSSLLTAIGRNLAPEVNKRYERAMFNLTKQNEGESYQDYFNRLKTMIKSCQYESLEQDLLLDKIICSIRDIRMREKLWLDKNITLNNAIQTCLSKEISDQQLKDLEEEKQIEVNKVRKYQTRTSEGRHKMYPSQSLRKAAIGKEEIECKYCGGTHEKYNCPAKGATCRYCQKKDHFYKVCYRRKMKMGKASEVKEVEYSGEEDDEELEKSAVLSIKSPDEAKNEINVELTFEVNNTKKKIRCQLVTGASCNVIGLNQLCSLLNDNNPKLMRSSLLLKGFGGKITKPLGKILLKCLRKRKEFNLLFQVVDLHHKPLLSANACKVLDLIRICNKVITHPVERNKEAENLFKEYGDVFEGLGQIEGEIALEVDEKVKPSIEQPRRIPVALRDELEKILLELEEGKIIKKEDGYTDWASNITLVKKSNGKLRICIDPLKLNKALKSYKYQIPTLEEVIPDLADAKVFTTLDAKNGFWQLKLDEDSSKLTTFWTPKGKYRWLRLPFGLSPSMEIFQKKLHEVVHGLDGVISIADDIIVFGRGKNQSEALADHHRNLKRLLERLRERNVKLNKEKVRCCQKEVKFFGHILTSEGVKPDPAKISAIKNMKEPTSKSEVMKFLGMVTYLGKYIPSLAKISEPLRKLTHDNETFCWKQIHQRTFHHLKEVIEKDTILRYFDVREPITIQTDASAFAIGSCLMQKTGPVAFASKTLTPCQQKYCQLEKEMLAIVYACKKFHQYIAGCRDIVVQTDHKPIISILAKPLIDTPKRLQNMILQLQRYNMSVKYIKGTEMHVADLLSRIPEEKEEKYEVFEIKRIFDEIEEVNSLENNPVSDATVKEMLKEIKEDEVMKTLFESIQKGWPEHIREVPMIIRPYWKYKEELHTQDGLIFKRDRIVIPPRMRKKILEKLHTCHQGIEYTANIAKERVFWPSITSQIKEKVQNCELCMKYSRNQQKPPLVSTAIPRRPFEIVSMDVFEMMIRSQRKRFLVIVDHYSDFFEIEELKDMTAKCTILMCKKNFSRYGIPNTVISDNGTNFVNEEFRRFKKDWDFVHITSSPNHPQGNGKAESAVKIAKNLIRKAIESNTDIYEMILVERNTPNKMGSSPAQRFFARHLRCCIPIKESKLNPKVVREVDESIRKQRDYVKVWYDKSARDIKRPYVGERVLFKKGKEDKTWTSGKVKERVHPRSYVVNDERENTYRRNLIDIRVRRADEERREDGEPDGRGEEVDSAGAGESTARQRPRRSTHLPEKYQDYHMY